MISDGHRCAIGLCPMLAFDSRGRTLHHEFHRPARGKATANPKACSLSVSYPNPGMNAVWHVLVGIQNSQF